MAFTDDDLKRLKERLNDPIDDEIDKSLEALIARLEAAELLANCLSNHDDLDPVEITEIKNWRKAAGKEG